MGNVLSISPRDRKMVIFGENHQIATGFHLNTYSEQLNNVKNKEKNLLNNEKNILLNISNYRNSHQNNNNNNNNNQKDVNNKDGNQGFKKHSIFINALNLGKHFSVGSRKKNLLKQQQQNQQRQEKEKAAQVNNSVNNNLNNNNNNNNHNNNNNINININLQQSENLNNQTENKNISKSLSCYNIKSGITANNIEVVKNISAQQQHQQQQQQQQQSTQKPAEILFQNQCQKNRKEENDENNKNKRCETRIQPIITLTKPAGPPLPPKPLLLGKNSIRPTTIAINQKALNEIKNGISLTNNVAEQAAKVCDTSSTVTQKKTVIQVRLIYHKNLLSIEIFFFFFSLKMRSE